MSVLVVGSTALDSIKTPDSENPKLLGGSASHAAVAASFFGPVKLVGVVGDDFPKKYIDLYRRHKIDLTGLQILPGETNILPLSWTGQYSYRMTKLFCILDLDDGIRTPRKRGASHDSYSLPRANLPRKNPSGWQVC